MVKNNKTKNSKGMKNNKNVSSPNTTDTKKKRSATKTVKIPKTVQQTIPYYAVYPDEQFIETLSEADQEAADQINRRTEFQVLSINYNMF